LMEWRPRKRISSLTPHRRRWRISGVTAPPRRSSASTRHSYTTRPRRRHAAATQLIPNHKVVWLVLDNHLNFVEDQSEWVGTKISFEIAPRGDQTEVRFAHLGLVPQYECFAVCSNAWGSLKHGSLRRLIATGTGNPYRKWPRAGGERLRTVG